MTGRPADWVADACADLGTDAVVAWCVGLLTGQPVDDAPSLDRIGGPGAADLVAGYEGTPGKPDYWPRVWAARALRGLLDDDVARVRIAAARALAVVGHDDLDALATATEPDASVRRVRDGARRRLAERLDLPDPATGER